VTIPKRRFEGHQLEPLIDDTKTSARPRGNPNYVLVIRTASHAAAALIADAIADTTATIHSRRSRISRSTVRNLFSEISRSALILLPMVRVWFVLEENSRVR
jgi:hypothetical protein